MSCKSKKARNSKTSKIETTKKLRKKLISTEFILMAPEAQKVFLAGDFNNWNPTEFSMRKFKNGSCKKKVKLNHAKGAKVKRIATKNQSLPENKNTQ